MSKVRAAWARFCARRRLRRAGICTVHFTPMRHRLDFEFGCGYFECTLCEMEHNACETARLAKAIAALRGDYAD